MKTNTRNPNSKQVLPKQFDISVSLRLDSSMGFEVLSKNYLRAIWHAESVSPDRINKDVVQDFKNQVIGAFQTLVANDPVLAAHKLSPVLKVLWFSIRSAPLNRDMGDNQSVSSMTRVYEVASMLYPRINNKAKKALLAGLLDVLGQIDSEAVRRHHIPHITDPELRQQIFGKHREYMPVAAETLREEPTGAP